MGKSRDQIRQEIAATRERLTQTIDALGSKADVPARSLARAHANEAVRGPLLIALGALCAGALVGALAPRTQLENRAIGESAARSRDQLRSEAVSAAKSIVADAGRRVPAGVL